MLRKSGKIREQVEGLFIEKHQKSQDFFERGQKVFTGGMPRNLQFHKPFPIVIHRGEGSRLYDLDGNEYTDYLNNFASLILGHCHPRVLEAVQKAIARGTVHSNPTPIQYEFAELLCKRIPCVDQIRFLNSGTEAGMWVVRLARAYTGRNKILKMEGGYHGLSDALNISVHPTALRAGSPTRPSSVPEDHGNPPGVIQDTLVAPFNDKEATRAILEENASELAAVIVEPYLGSGGGIPARDGYLDFLRDLTARHNILLIFDEVITLRLAYGGGQERFNVIPDLCMMGKIIGGGFPVGAFGGRREIMALISPLNTAVAHSGTFSANNATMAAGMATMQELNHAAYEALESKGERLRKGAEDLFKSLDIGAQMTGLGSCFQIHFLKEPVKSPRDLTRARDDILVPSLLNLALLNRGVYLSRRASGYLSVVNTEEEIDFLLEALHDALKEIRPVIEEEAPELILG